MIEVVDITKSYGPVKALDRLSFGIRQGEVFGLLGPNGAGKTTTIKVLTTLARPDSGRCIIAGRDVLSDRTGIRRLIGVVPQENNLDRELTAYENMLIYGMLHGVSDLGKRIGEALEAVDLLDRKDFVVSHFSGGMQRRLILARALLPEPSVLFLDEPSVGLDPQIRRHIWDIIRKIRKGGRTVVITTHYIEEAEALCDRVGIIMKGQLIALDTPANLKASVGGYVVEYLDKDGKLFQEISKTRQEAHELARDAPAAVTVRESNLEDVFVKLTGQRIS